MAVQPGSTRTVPLYVLIIFVVLFLASVTGLVILFLYQEDLRVNAEAAQEKYAEYVGRQNETRLETYLEKGRNQSPPKTAVGALFTERDQLSRTLTGSAEAGPAQVDKKLNTVLANLPQQAQPLKNQAKSDLVGALTQAGTLIQQMSKRLSSMQKELQDAQNTTQTVTSQYRELEKKFSDASSRITTQLQNLKQQIEDYKNRQQQQLDSLKSQIGGDLQNNINSIQKEFNNRVSELRNLVRRNLQSLMKSMKELGPAQQRAKETLTVDKLLQQPDGQVLITTDDVIYVSLGEKENVRQGMRFYVYSALKKGSTKPQPKAVIEITSVDKLTSQATLVTQKEGSPIVKGDLLGNMVYDPDLELTFVVLGDFDFNNDTIPDPNGVQRVTEIINNSGGKVASQLSPQVDFVILGMAPEVPPEPGFGASAQARNKYDQQVKRNRQYEEAKDQAKALALPLIQPQVFMKYTGYVESLD